MKNFCFKFTLNACLAAAVLASVPALSLKAEAAAEVKLLENLEMENDILKKRLEALEALAVKEGLVSKDDSSLGMVKALGDITMTGFVQTTYFWDTAVEKCGWFPEVNRTRIGSPYAIAAMQHASESGAKGVVGYEANGGFLLNSDIQQDGRTLRSSPTRDAVLVILSNLITAVREMKKISELMYDLPARYTASDRVKDFPTDKSKAILARFTTGMPLKTVRRLNRFWQSSRQSSEAGSN